MRSQSPPTPIVCLLAAFVLLTATAPAAGDDPIPFDSERWVINAQEAKVEQYQGRPSLFLRGGTVWIGDDAFESGLIEFDISFPEVRGFVGAVWRLQDSANYEHFYMRPHQSGNPDANQYTPVFHGVSGWQLYHGPAYASPIEYRYDEWQHVRIVFSGSRAEIYVDSEEPVLVVPELKRETRPGFVGLTAGGPTPVRFSNFRYRKTDKPELVGGGSEEAEAPAGAIDHWQVSNVFSRTAIEGQTELTNDPAETWTTLAAESTGIANLARVQGPTQEARTVFARQILTSSKAQVKKFRFGYSDAAAVYLNGKRLYSGQRAYRSRDYRYLGTIGIFDELYLPLEEGENELRIAVFEAFGGWGLIGAIEDREGLSVETAGP